MIVKCPLSNISVISGEAHFVADDQSMGIRTIGKKPGSADTKGIKPGSAAQKSHKCYLQDHSPYSTEKRVCIGCPMQMKLT